MNTTIEALTDKDLRVLAHLFESLVTTADEEGKRARRNYWRSLTVEIFRERQRREVEYERADEMIWEALGAGPVEITWTPRPDLNWNGTLHE